MKQQQPFWLEAIRVRALVVGTVASGCFIMIGIVCAPVITRWRWVLWPMVTLLIVGCALMLYAYHLWTRYLSQVEQQEDAEMKTYTVLCRPSGVAGWAISVPELKGVHSQAQDIDQVEIMARNAIANFLAVAPDSFNVRHVHGGSDG